ncbi:tetratricopeptide repeat protein [uncultured Mucilaginibacter sp.]|uniref:tetratricopeptide repeat protein n=1 Tax=uncultured Mucilaginibacter sp. TaxID=797541 RepID=UPI0025FE8E28|nr:tetratricopeptide repeat protein [uncultured Mucilaginibacter sp.]
MKPIILLLLTTLASGVFGQSNRVDTLQFDKRYTRCEKQWVAFKNKKDKEYSYGYIYIDAQAGFTYDAKGTFTIGADDKYIADTTISKNSSIKYRIAPNWGNVALIPTSRYKELNLPAEPSWLKFYYNYTDTVAHNVRWGWTYNAVNDCEIALLYLQKAYAVKPHAEGLEFEMAYAYNALGQLDNAISILNAGLAFNPKDVMLIRELGYSYLQKADYPNCIRIYKQGIEQCTDKQIDTKSEMALNLSAAYKRSGDEGQYKTWLDNARNWAPVGSPVAEIVKRQQ